MKVVIRVDSSRQIGTGHVMRCLTLANQLKQYQADVTFVCRKLDSDIIERIRSQGFAVTTLSAPESTETFETSHVAHEHWLQVPWEQDANETIAALNEISGKIDWLIVDHYAIDERWEGRLRPHCGKIMVIDDLADRHHNCDLLLDQNYYAEYRTRYENLVDSDCRLCLGPKFTLLREEFHEQRKLPGRKAENCNRILVFFGGVDSHNLTGRTLKAIRELRDSDIQVTAILGQSSVHRERIAHEFQSESWLLMHNHSSNIAHLMGTAVLAVGGGGTTTWERCVLGLPTITVSVAENQTRMLNDLHNYGAVMNLGWHGNLTDDELSDAIRYMLDNSEARSAISKKCLELVEFESKERTATIADVLKAMCHAEQTIEEIGITTHE